MLVFFQTSRKLREDYDMPELAIMIRHDNLLLDWSPNVVSSTHPAYDGNLSHSTGTIVDITELCTTMEVYPFTEVQVCTS